MEGEKKVIEPMKKTKTAWDEPEYMNILKSAIIKSNGINRSGDKPMAALSDKFDSHLSYRLVHQLDVASIMKRLADGLGLNGELAYVGMLMHDIGHPFSAHDGEEIFTSIGKLYNCGYFHHNAKGVEVIKAENILGTALGMIPNIDYRPDLEKMLKKDFNYFLDIVISHDGEANPNDMKKKPIMYESIEKAVEDKLRKSNTQNDYKFVSQTPEGMLGKYADVIAYLSSDIRDAFRLGIMKTFNDRYLEIFGRIVAPDPEKIADDEEGRRTVINIAKAKISEIQEKYLEEVTEDISNENNVDVVNTAKKTIKEINESRINTYVLSKYYDSDEGSENFNCLSDEAKAKLDDEDEAKKIEVEDQINAILQKNLEEFVAKKGEYSENEIPYIEEKIRKITEYVNNMIYVNTRVVNEVTNIVQEFFINDLINNTKQQINTIKEKIENGELEEKEAIVIPLLSDRALSSDGKITVNSIYKNARNFGYTFYLPYVKTRYQKELLPENVKKIVKECADRLLKDGIIVRKLSEHTVSDNIPPEILKYANIEAPDNIETRNLKDFISNQKIRGHFSADKHNKRGKFNIFSKLKTNINKQGSRLAKTYMYTFEAIENQVRNKVSRALSSDYKFDREKTEVLEIQVENEIARIREKILSSHPNIATNPKNEEEKIQQEQQKEQIIKDMIEEERKKIVEKMAIQIAIDYVSGMTDEGIKDLAIDMGYMTQEKHDEYQAERGGTTSTMKELQDMTK